MISTHKALQKRLLRAGLLVGSLYPFVHAQIAAAQTATAPTAEAGSSGQLQEVVVTAQRRRETLQTVPVAVTAFTARDLAQKDVRTARDLISSTPNLQLIRPPGTDPNFVSFSIRGFNISRPLIGVQQPVGVYIDDFFYPSLSGSLLRVSDLQSVEVLRGPQGTLFGQNSLGGAVRYNTIQPNDVFSGHAEVTYGERDREDFSGAVNIPIISDVLAVRLAGASYEQNGYVKDVTTGKPVGNSDDKVVRLQARYTPTSKITVDVAGEYAKSNFNGDDQVVSSVVGSGPFSDPLAGGTVTFPGTFVPNFYNLIGQGSPGFIPYNSSFDSTCKYCASGTTAPEYSDTTTKDIRVTAAWAISKALTLKSLTSYFDITNSSYIDTDRTPANDSQEIATSHTHSFSQELQLSGVLLGDRLNYVGGFYYFHLGEADVADSFGFLPAQVTLTTDERSSYALYAQGSYKITSKMTATIGGRETLEDVNVSAQTLPSAATVPPGAEFSGFTPTFKLQYQFTPDFMAYASASKGFRGGTINTVDPKIYPQVPADRGEGKVDPDTAWSYEIGARTQFFDHRLRLNATAFDAEYKNIQTLLAYPPTTGLPIPQSILDNVGNARMYGLELEALAVLGKLHLHSTLSTINARYTSINASESVSDITTRSYIEHTPRYTYSIGGDYDFVLPKGDVLATLDYGFQDRQVAGNQDHLSIWLPAYGLLNGRLAWRFDEHITLSVEAKNILDKFYVINANNNLFYTGLSYYEPGEPRTISGTLQYKF